MEDTHEEVILSIRGLCKSFGRNQVLDHINLDLRSGRVMGLMGENGAGKSTMMKCLFGSYQKDEGTIILDGQEVSFSGPKDALENGIAMVHQELNQCLERNVVDNLFLGRYPVNSLGVVDEGRMKKEAAELFRRLGMTVNLTQPMRKMSVSQRQMCEIAKAISYNAKVIVLDEPTSSLMTREVDKLFEMMRALKKQGIAIVYISHKMDEVFQICDDVSVLRDGKLVMTKHVKDTNMNELISAMVGRSLDKRFLPWTTTQEIRSSPSGTYPRNMRPIFKTFRLTCAKERYLACMGWWALGARSCWRLSLACARALRGVSSSETT